MRSEAEVLEDIRSQGNITTRCLLRDLLKSCIERSRIKNDTATGENYLRNQGAIQEHLRLLQEIEEFQEIS